MRILCLTSRLPFPMNRGDRVRACNFIRQLSKEHELHLISFFENEREKAGGRVLQSWCRKVHLVHRSSFLSVLQSAGSFISGLPLQTRYYRSRNMFRLVDKVLKYYSFDLIYVHMFRMVQYVIEYKNIYKIVDLTDVVSSGIHSSLKYRKTPWRILYRLEGPRIASFEKKVVQSFDETWLISEAERQAMSALGVVGNVHVVPNGVDFSIFRPLGGSPVPQSLIFVGHFGVFHNRDAAIYLARNIFPKVRKRVPGATLSLIGARPDSEIIRLGHLPGIEVTGYVQDLNRALNSATVFVAPLRCGGGVQNKVLEAMSVGRPVVASSQVNRGLGAEAGTHLLVADGPQATADAVVKILQCPAFGRQMGSAGQSFVREKFTWEAVGHRVREVEQSLVEK